LTKELDFYPRLLNFSSDNAGLAVYGAPMGSDGLTVGEPRALLLDAASLEIEWEISLPGITDGQIRLTESDGSESFEWWGPAAVFSPEQQKLYLVHADEEKLTTVDFAQQATGTVTIQPAQSWLEQLFALTAGVARAKALDGTMKSAVISRDGSELYIVGQTSDTWKDDKGNWQFTQTPLGLMVVDAATGVEKARLDNDATELVLSPEGEILYLRGWSENSSWTDVVDTATLEVEKHLEGRYLVPGRKLNGKPILLSETYFNTTGQATLAVLDPETHETIKKWSAWNSSWLARP
jgi:hypothetical protein